MRLGRYPQAMRRKLSGRRPVWVHAVSVGEVLAARPLIEAISRRLPEEPPVISSITPGGFDLARKRAGERGVAFYWPFDLRGPVRSAFDCVSPRLLLLMESELWPTAIAEASRRQVPVAIVNGRISKRAFDRYRRVPGLMRGMLSRVALCAMQSQADAQRARELGAAPQRVQVCGSLKWDASIESRPDSSAVQDAANRLGLSGAAPVLMAGSTHRAEEPILIDAARRLLATHPSLRLIVAPRHLERVSEVEVRLQRAGFSTMRWSQAAGQRPWQALIVDAFGCLPLFYALSDVAFIGGSLIAHGGQNPLEAASLGKPTVFGPSMHNFQEIADALVSASACRQLRSATELLPALESLLADSHLAKDTGQRARALTEQSKGAVARTLQALEPLLLNCPSP
jgi:3-deoxy-D-manno-octulosonic-acid transferase